MTSISANYKPMAIGDLANVRHDAWKNPEIPQRQYELCVKHELECYRSGGYVAPFNALVNCLRRIPRELDNSETTILDAGCSSGYYSEVLDIAGFKYRYTGVDFSEAFIALARQLYPDRDFHRGDASRLNLADGSIDIVLSSAVMMHCLDYDKVLAEAVRVAHRYVILHRTPVFDAAETRYFTKEAYGVPVIEIHFDQNELLALFDRYGLTMVYYTDVFREEGFAHRSYLLRKDSVFHVGL